MEEPKRKIDLYQNLLFNELYIWLNVINRGFISGSIVICDSERKQKEAHMSSIEEISETNEKEEEEEDIDVHGLNDDDIEKYEEEPVQDVEIVEGTNNSLIEKVKTQINDYLKTEEYLINMFAIESLGQMILGLTSKYSDSDCDIFKFIDNNFNSINVLLNDISIEELKTLLEQFYKTQIHKLIETEKIKCVIVYFAKKYLNLFNDKSILDKLSLEIGKHDEEFKINELTQKLEEKIKLIKGEKHNYITYLSFSQSTPSDIMSWNSEGGKRKKKKNTKKRFEKKSTKLKITKSKKKKQIGGQDFKLTNVLNEKPIEELSFLNDIDLLKNQDEFASKQITFVSSIGQSYSPGFGTLDLEMVQIQETNKYFCIFLDGELLRLKNFLILERVGPKITRYCLLFTYINNLVVPDKIGAERFFTGDLDKEGDNNLKVSQFYNSNKKIIFKIEFLKEHLGYDFYFCLFPNEPFDIGEDIKEILETSECSSEGNTDKALDKISLELVSIKYFYSFLKYLKTPKLLSGGSLESSSILQSSIFNTPEIHEIYFPGSIPKGIKKYKYTLYNFSEFNIEGEDSLIEKIEGTQYEQKKIGKEEGASKRKSMYKLKSDAIKSKLKLLISYGQPQYKRISRQSTKKKNLIYRSS